MAYHEGRFFVQLFRRVIRVCGGDSSVYDEIAADDRSSLQAFFIMMLSSTACAAGFYDRTPWSIQIVFLILVGGGLLFYGLAYVLGALVFAEKANRAYTTRIGDFFPFVAFSTAPGVLCVLGRVPVIGWSVCVLAVLWMSGAVIFAVRAAFDHEKLWRSLIVCALSGAGAIGGIALLLKLLV